MDELVHICITRTKVDLLLQFDPGMYGPYVTYEKGRKSNLCGITEGSLWNAACCHIVLEKAQCKIGEEGHTPNPYDSYTVNKMNGKQSTIVWHVDDLKISHVDSKVVDG